jgi:hypothetical protein
LTNGDRIQDVKGRRQEIENRMQDGKCRRQNTEDRREKF